MPSSSRAYLILGRDGVLGAVHDGPAHVVFVLCWNDAVILSECEAEVVELEHLRAERVTTRMTLTDLAIDADPHSAEI
jgi:hypothetical protein